MSLYKNVAGQFMWIPEKVAEFFRDADVETIARKVYDEAPFGGTEDGWDAQSPGYKNRCREVAKVALLEAAKVIENRRPYPPAGAK
jgi:hypothetical protein